MPVVWFIKSANLCIHKSMYQYYKPAIVKISDGLKAFQPYIRQEVGVIMLRTRKVTLFLLS